MRSVIAILLASAVSLPADVPSIASKPLAARTSAPMRTNEVDVIGTDYAFRLPAELPAGPTTFRFRNDGKMRHEFSIVRLRKGATIDQFIRLSKEAKAQPVVDGEVGVLFADPGKRSTSGLTTDLVAGRQYAVRCALRDTLTGPPHFEMGMYSVLSVRPSKRAPSRRISADTIFATDYAFRYPRALSPGPHTLVFRNDGKVMHELNIALLKKGVSLNEFMDARNAGRNVRALTDEGLGVLFTQPGEETLGRLEVNLLPGREYRIICIFTDNPKSPPHFSLGMFGSIRVPGKPSS